MESNLEHKPLKSFLAEKPRNGLYKGKEHQGSGNRWIKMNEVFSLDFISNENTTEKLIVTESEVERFSCKSGDLLFGRTSLTLEGVGDCLLVQDIFDQPIFESNLFRLRFDLAKAYPLFFYYFFKSHYGRQIIQRIAKQTAATSITATDLIEEDVPNLSYSDQVKIANLLYRFDNKIELNQKTNQTLEQMAQALFKSWFVDFDPVFDNLLASVDFKLENLETSLPDELKQKAQRRLAALDSLHNAAQCKASLIALAHELQIQLPTKEATQAAEQASGQTAETPVKADFNANPKILAQHANTHAHFPNAFEHNEQLGWIPKGWEDVKVNEMVRTVSETYPLKSVDKVIFLNTGDILEGKFLHSEFSNTEGLPGQAKKSIKKGDILYSEIRPKNKRFALVNFDASEHVVSTKLMVLRPNEGFEELFPYFVLTQEHNISLLQQAAESRSGTFPQITFTELAMIKIALPKDKKLINIFISSFLKDHFAQKDKRDFQNKTLTKLRDTLLPKLISGELQIPDVATDVEVVD